MNIPQPLSLPRLQANLTSITNVNIQPLPLASILDHHLRRPDHQDRVFGTLLGVRNIETGEVEVRSSFGVPYAANGRDVAVDSDHHRTLLELHHRVSPKEVVVGWYATSPVLNSFSSLIQDFYNTESVPLPAIHLTLDPVSLTFKTYISSPIGLSTLQTLNLLFKPVPSTLSIPTAERTALELISKPILNEKLPKMDLDSTIKRFKEPISTELPIYHLQTLLIKLKEMVVEVNEYVDKVNQNLCAPNHQLGQFLLNTLNSISINKTLSFEDSFQSHLADVLMVSYVSTLVREQVEISSRLNLLVSQ